MEQPLTIEGSEDTGRVEECPRIMEAIEKESDYPEEDIALIRKAWLFARTHYNTKLHKSGVPLMKHCCDLVQKLWEIKSDAHILAAGFLHDILKHTSCRVDDLTHEFGEEIVQLVSGVQMFHVPESHIDKYLENLEKLFFEMTKDVRIAIIRLVHRLDDLENFSWRKPAERKKMLTETREIFIPLAERLGMRSLTGRLEDLAFKYAYPSIYQALSKKQEQTRKEDETYLDLVGTEIRKLLSSHSIDAVITGRIKGIYSLYRKMILQKKPLDKLHDKIAIRIIVDDIPTCYQVMGILHTNFTHVPGTFDDYISLPKANNYQSLHTCIYPIRNLAEKPIEIQIRTYGMHQVAEYGIAAHWKYKEDTEVLLKPDEQAAWIQSLLDLKKSHKSSRSFYSALKKSISLKYIIVFDELGKVMYLPKGSTPLDYGLHRGLSINPKKDRVKINGKPSKFNIKLQNGDTVELIIED